MMIFASLKIEADVFLFVRVRFFISVVEKSLKVVELNMMVIHIGKINLGNSDIFQITGFFVLGKICLLRFKIRIALIF